MAQKVRVLVWKRSVWLVLAFKISVVGSRSMHGLWITNAGSSLADLVVSFFVSVDSFDVSRFSGF